MSFRFQLFVLSLLALFGCARYSPKPISLGANAQSFDSRSLTNSDLRSFIDSVLTNRAHQHWTLDELTLAALWFDPALQVARAQSSLANAASLTAETRPNPTMGLTPGYNFSAVNPVSPWIPGMTVDVPIETAGKRGKRMLLARYNAEAARLDIAATAWQIRSNVHGALIEFSAAHRRESLIAQQITNQSALIQLLEQRLAAGALASAEIAPFQIGRIKLQSDFAAARSACVQARTHLAEAIGVPAPALANLQITEDLQSSIPSNVRASALQHRPDLLALLARYEAAQAALQLEIAKQYPDVHLGSGYQWDQGENKWNLAFNFELPIFNRNRGPIAEAETRRAQSAAQVFEAQARIANQIDGALAALKSAQEEAARADEAVVALKRQSNLTRERVNAGGADQVEAITAAIEESAAALLALDAKTRVAAAQAQLEAAAQISPSYLSVAVSYPHSTP